MENFKCNSPMCSANFFQAGFTKVGLYQAAHGASIEHNSDWDKGKTANQKLQPKKLTMAIGRIRNGSYDQD